MGYRITQRRENMNQAVVEKAGIIEKYQPLIESWEPKENTIFINSKCRELIGYLEKTTTFNLFPYDMRKAKKDEAEYTCENGQSIIIDSGGKKLFVQFIKDLDTNEELKILLKNLRCDDEKYEYCIIILIGETNPEMPEKIDKFIENNRIRASLLKK